jgi:hypothetical protein
MTTPLTDGASQKRLSERHPRPAHHWAADGALSPAETRGALAARLRAVLGPHQ